MCGIAGILNYKYKSPVSKELAEEMTLAIAHRGPDDSGKFFLDEKGLFLGHRRLSIIDLVGGHQPMASYDNSVQVIFNGEIYNFLEIRNELISRGYSFKTKSDTEVIIYTYKEWGPSGFEKLNGMYAFAIWDNNNDSLIIARDPFGIKPLYYFNNGSTLIFSSEVKPILINPIVKREIDMASLYEFITYTYVPSPKTVFKGIFKLPPGHLIEIKNNTVFLKRFYNIKPEKFIYKSQADVIDRLQQEIFSAVKRQMISDVPVGAMLSGGVDSSTIVTIMTQISNYQIKTFTVGFEGDFKSNELSEARYIADKIGSSHHDLILSSADYSNFLPFSIWHMEEPVSTGSILAYYMICKLAREHVKVVLTGQGADEPFAGYPRHLGERFGYLYRKLPKSIRDFLISPVSNLMPRNEQLKRAVNSLGEIDPVKRMVKVYETLNSKQLPNLFKENFYYNFNKNIMDAVTLWQKDVNNFDEFSQMLYVDSRLSLPDNLLLYGDKMSMAVSLEARVPFLDLELMKLVESIPSNLKVHGFTQKYILKKAVEKWIPKQVINRKKIGFATPLDAWFQKELNSTLKDLLLSENSGVSEFFNVNTVNKMLENHKAKREDFKRPLFSLITFELWYQLFIKPSDAEFKHNTLNSNGLKYF